MKCIHIFLSIPTELRFDSIWLGFWLCSDDISNLLFCISRKIIFSCSRIEWYFTEQSIFNSCHLKRWVRPISYFTKTHAFEIKLRSSTYDIHDFLCGMNVSSILGISDGHRACLKYFLALYSRSSNSWISVSVARVLVFFSDIKVFIYKNNNCQHLHIIQISLYCK